MTTLLPRDKKDLILSVLPAAKVFIAMLVIESVYKGHSTTPKEVARLTGLDERTVNNQMEFLSDGNRAIFDGRGYVLTEGSALLLGTQAQVHAQDCQDVAPQALGADSAQIVKEKTTQIVQNEPAHIVCALKLKEEEKDSLNLKKEESSPPPQSAQNVQLTTAQILAATPILFGEPGVVAQGLGDLELIQPCYALGWVAHAYTLRRTPENPSGLYAPAGLVYKKLKDPECPKPREKFYVAPLNYLSDEYLEALGMVEYHCEACEMTFTKHAELHEHEVLMMQCEYGCGKRFHDMEKMLEHHKGHAKSGDFGFERLPDDHPASRLWALVKKQLQMEMPAASFETWIRDTEAVDMDEQSLTVGVRNAYGLDWIESRLKEKIKHMVNTYQHTPLTVLFQVGKILEEE